MKNIEDLDLYELLGVNSESKTKEIKSAYRKKALTCHPDKNPDNPKAAETFQELQKALEILIDDKARKAYDVVFKARNAAKIRHAFLDEKRKKLKEDLEERERLAETKKYKDKSYQTPEQKLKAEIERLRTEGSNLIKEEILLVQKQVEEELRNRNLFNLPSKTNIEYRLRVKWKVEKNDPLNGGYNQDNLRKIFEKYGDVNALIISSKKNGSALVEYLSYNSSCMAIRFEKGFDSNPLKIELLSESGRLGKSEKKSNPQPAPTTRLFPAASYSDESTSTKIIPEDLPSFSFNSTFNVDSCCDPLNERDNRDFESLELRKLRQAEERKRLIDQIQAEDNADD